MGVFDGKKPLELPTFTSRQGAFNFMLNYMITEKKADPMEAAEKANEFAKIFAENNGLPAVIEPEQKGIKKYMGWAKEVAKFVEENPKVVEIGTAVVTAAAGFFVGRKVEENNEKTHNEQVEDIDFEAIEKEQQQQTHAQNGTTELEADQGMGGLPDPGTRSKGSADSDQIV